MEQRPGIFVLPMTVPMARALVRELEPLALQLGPRLTEFYEGLSHSIETVDANEVPENGVLYDNFSGHKDVPA